MFGGLFDRDDQRLHEDHKASLIAIQAIMIREGLTDEAELRELKEKYSKELAELAVERTKAYLASLNKKKEQGNV